MTDAGTIKKVRVFIDRASISRVRQVPIASGRGGAAERDATVPGVGLNQVLFEPIPLEIESDTLRASARLVGTDGAVRVNGVSAEVVYADRETKRQAEIKKELLDVEASLDALDDTEATEERAAALLERYAQLATGKLSFEWLDQSPSFDKWSVTFDHLRQKRSKLASARATRSAQYTKLQNRRFALQQEEMKLGRAEKLGYRVKVALTIEEATEGSVEVELSYLTYKAQWMPSYDARHLPAESDQPERISLCSVALVRQATGEDWSGVELIATTARPPLSEPPPDLEKIMVSGHQGDEDRQIVSTERAQERLAGAPGEAAAPATVEHVAPGTVSVPSTNQPVRVELFTSDIPCASRLEVAPLARPVAVLVAEFTNRTGRVLLPGTVNIFRGPNYSGQTPIGFISGGERVRIPLGTDASLRIKRDALSRPEKKAAITGTLSYHFEYQTVLENISSQSLDIIVRDRVPVARTDDTSVKILEIDRNVEIESGTGLTTIQLTIAPHTKREITTAFKITAPRGFSVAAPKEI